MRISKLVRAAFLATWVNIGLAHANLVTNGDFEIGDLTGWVQGGDTSFAGAGITAHTGLFGAILGPFELGTLSQVLPTTTGVTYELRFWLESDNSDLIENEFSALINNEKVFSVANMAGTPYEEHIYDFVAIGNDVLSFSFRNYYSFFNLDDVSVNPGAINSIPEPATATLLGLGLVGIGLGRKKGPGNYH